MKIQKFTGIVTAIVLSVTVLLAGCGNRTTASQENSSGIGSDISSNVEEKEDTNRSVSETASASSTASENSNISSTVNDSSGSSNTSSQSSESRKTSKPTNPGKPGDGGTATKPGKPNNGGTATKPSNSGNGGSSKPTEPETPTTPPPHVHNWVKQPKEMTVDWSQSNGPDENGYTTNKEIAADINGKKIGLYMCAKCFEYYGRFDDDKWIGRYWKHAEENKGHGGYSSYPAYAIYDLYYCEGCQSFKRGGLSFYGYADYSKDIPEWIYLEPWQIEELNLPM